MIPLVFPVLNCNLVWHVDPHTPLNDDEEQVALLMELKDICALLNFEEPKAPAQVVHIRLADLLVLKELNLFDKVHHLCLLLRCSFVQGFGKNILDAMGFSIILSLIYELQNAFPSILVAFKGFQDVSGRLGDNCFFSNPKDTQPLLFQFQGTFCLTCLWRQDVLNLNSRLFVEVF